MRSTRDVTKSYNDMIKMMDKEPSNDDKQNTYNCSCGHKTHTIDVDKGVTPFMHSCEKCGEFARSSMYQSSQDVKPTQEWYRPTLKQCLKMRKKEHGDAILNHVLQGGLEMRVINPL